jgi:hypothetical protein
MLENEDLLDQQVETASLDYLEFKVLKVKREKLEMMVWMENKDLSVTLDHVVKKGVGVPTDNVEIKVT